MSGFIIEAMPAGRTIYFTGEGWTHDRDQAALYSRPGDAPEVLTIPGIGAAGYFQGAYFPPGDEYGRAWLWRLPHEKK